MKRPFQTILFLMIAYSLQAFGSNSNNSHSKIQSIIEEQNKFYEELIPAFINKVKHYDTRFGFELKSLCKAANYSSWYEGLKSADELQLSAYCAAYEASQTVISSIQENKLRHESFIRDFNGNIDILEHNTILHSRLLQDVITVSGMFDALELLPPIKTPKQYKNYHAPYTQKDIEQVEKSNKRNQGSFGRDELDVYLTFADYCLRDDFDQYFKISLNKGRLKELDLSLVPKDVNDHIMTMGYYEQNRYFWTPNSKQLYIGVAEIAETSYCYVASPHIQPITLHWLATTYLKQRKVLHSLMKSGVTGHRVDVDRRHKAAYKTIDYNAHFNWKKDGIATFPITAYFAKGIAASQPKQLGVIFYKKKQRRTSFY